MEVSADIPRRENTATLLEPTTIPSDRGSLLWAGLLAGTVACGVPLIEGVVGGWSAQRLIGYALLSLVFLLLTQVQCLHLSAARWLREHLWVYLLLNGLVCLILQSMTGDPLIQPIAFTVPFVYAVLHLATLQTAVAGIGYLLLIMLGNWLSGLREMRVLLLPVASYGALMGFMYAFIRLSIQQAIARQRADVLAGDLARQRDYLARLVQINASLTRDLELATVLEQVAVEGRTLAHAEQVRVWLRDEESPPQELPRLKPAAAVPMVSCPPVASPVVERAWASRKSYVDGTMLVLPLVFKNTSIGVLELLDPNNAPFGEDDIALLQPFADAAVVAIENARLYEQSRLSATLAERNRLARELHDTIAQGLTAVTMQLAAALRSFERDPIRTRARVSRADELARETLDDVRRSVWALASPLIDGNALNLTLDDLTRRFASRTGINASYTYTGPVPALDHAAASQVLRIVQEALQNVEKHAHAQQVRVESTVDAQGLIVCVSDDGIGFDPAAPPVSNANGAGFGLMSLHERARLINGSVEIESAPGIGTRVRLQIPDVASGEGLVIDDVQRATANKELL